MCIRVCVCVSDCVRVRLRASVTPVCVLFQCISVFVYVCTL